MSVTLFGSDGPLLPEKLTGEDCKSFRTSEMSGTSVRVVTRFNFPLSGRSMKLSFSRSTQSLNIYPKTEMLCLYPNNMHQNKCAPNCFSSLKRFSTWTIFFASLLVTWKVRVSHRLSLKQKKSKEFHCHGILHAFVEKGYQLAWYMMLFEHAFDFFDIASTFLVVFLPENE